MQTVWTVGAVEMLEWNSSEVMDAIEDGERFPTHYTKAELWSLMRTSFAGHRVHIRYVDGQRLAVDVPALSEVTE